MKLTPQRLIEDYPAAVGISANPKVVLQQLNTELKERTHGWGERVRELHREAAYAERSSIIEQLRAAMPLDSILSVDVHVTGYAALQDFTVYGPGMYIFSGISVAMGIGLPEQSVNRSLIQIVRWLRSVAMVVS